MRRGLFRTLGAFFLVKGEWSGAWASSISGTKLSLTSDAKKKRRGIIQAIAVFVTRANCCVDSLRNCSCGKWWTKKGWKIFGNFQFPNIFWFSWGACSDRINTIQVLVRRVWILFWKWSLYAGTQKFESGKISSANYGKHLSTSPLAIFLFGHRTRTK